MSTSSVLPARSGPAAAHGAGLARAAARATGSAAGRQPAPGRRRTARLAVALGLVLAALAGLGPAAGRAETAPLQWQPTATDPARTLRRCPMEVVAPSQPVCWSVTEDTTAWMARPSDSPDPWGQCTYYVGVMRPDIWNDRAPPSMDSLDGWDAWTWVQHAQAEGLSVDGAPQPGDVMVYSRAAVGNSTGHVAIVDSVDGADASAADLILTISEMNVEGLDTAAQGQGDTSTVLVPRSQLVPGMIQFIHRPGPGYTPPPWPTGRSQAGAQPAAQAPQNPSLAVAVADDGIAAVTQSPAPLQANVTAVSTGATVRQLVVAANRTTVLALPRGTYRVCVSQTADGGWAPADACATGTWQGPVNAAMSIGRPRRSGRRVRFAVVVRAASPGPGITAGTTFAATAQITIRSTQRIHGRAVTRWIVLRTRLRLHDGRQTVQLTLGRSPALRRGALVVIRIDAPPRAGAAVVASAAAAATLP